MDADPRVARWVEGYVRAWSSNDPADIGALFADDASYRTEPHAEPWRGRDAIVAGWLARREEPGSAEFSWRQVVAADGLAIVEGTTLYHDPPQTYDNLWVIHLDGDGRCSSFTEWWMLRTPAQS